MLNSLSFRTVFAALVVFTLTANAFAILFLQQHLGLAPCPLCVTQRAFFLGVTVFAFFGALHNPSGWGRRVYAGLCLLSAGIGGAVSARHVWLQSLPEDQVPACGPSLEYMLETLPFAETFKLVMMGDGNCAETVWTFLGLSIPAQTLLVFIATAAVATWQLLRRDPEAK